MLADYENALAPRLAHHLQDKDVTVENYTDAVQDEESLFLRLRDANVVVVIRERTTLSGSLLSRLNNLQLIVTTGSNTSVIDLKAGIRVCATRSMASAAAELTWALILASAREIESETHNLRSGKWQQSVGTALEGKQLGILGLGRIGTRVARVADAFGMNVVAWSRSLTSEGASGKGVRAVSKEELLSTSDVISLHLRLGESSRGIIGEEALSRMKSDALLVNTARAALVQEGPLIEALNSGRLRRFAQDVFLEEPLPSSSVLRGAQGALLTPHLGYMTDLNVNLFAEDSAEDILGFYSGNLVRALN